MSNGTPVTVAPAHDAIGHTIATTLLTIGGLALSTFANTPWGMILVPAVLGITKAIDGAYALQGKQPPVWLAWIH